MGRAISLIFILLFSMASYVSMGQQDAYYTSKQLTNLSKYISDNRVASAEDFSKQLGEVGYHSTEVAEVLYKFITDSSFRWCSHNEEVKRHVTHAKIKELSAAIIAFQKREIEDWRNNKKRIKKALRETKDSIKVKENVIRLYSDSLIMVYYKEDSVRLDTMRQQTIIERDILKNQVVTYNLILETIDRLDSKIESKAGATRDLLEENLENFTRAALAGVANHPGFFGAEYAYIEHSPYPSYNLARSGAPETELIDNLAILIASKLKDEVRLTFFSKLHQSLAKDSLLKELFPYTLNMLGSSDVFEQKTLGSNWHYVFAKDLANIPTHLSKVPKGILRPDQLNAVNLVFQIAESLKDGNDFLEVIDLMSNQSNQKHEGPTTKYLMNVVRFIDVLNKNLVNYKAGEQYYVTYEDFKSMSINEKEFFFALLYCNKPKVFDAIYGDDFCNQYRAKKTQFHNSFIVLVQAVNRFEAVQKELLASSNEMRYLYQYWDALANMIDKVAGLSGMPGAMQKNTPELVRLVLQMEKAIESRKYGELVTVSSQVILKVLDKTSREFNYDPPRIHHMKFTKYLDKKSPSKKKAELFFGAKSLLMSSAEGLLYAGDTTQIESAYTNSLILADSLKRLDRGFFSKNKKVARQLDRIHTFKESGLLAANRELWDANRERMAERKVDQFLGLSSFLADILAAQNSTELSEVVQSRAAPASSYKIKRNTSFSLDVNAYPGLYVGREWLWSSMSNPGLVTGFTSPVAVTLSWGSRDDVTDKAQINKFTTYQNRKGQFRNLTGNSFSMIFSVIDIGAVVSYRLTNTTERPLPQEVNFSQIFAPGFYLGFGVRNTPLALLVGGQINPYLRSFSNAPTPQDIFKISATLSFDIPIYNIWNTKKPLWY